MSLAPSDELTIGSVVLTGRAVLAPMAGVTDAPFRRLAMRYGAGAMTSEMAGSREMLTGSRQACQRVKRADVSPHIVQLAGCEAESLAEAARMAEAAGADIIDLNMGCPARRVINGWAGSALMRDLDHAERLIVAVLAAVKRPVTVKMRLGWDEQSRNAAELAQRAEQAGCAAVTVHGRTRAQFYKGRADWNAVKAVKESVRVPVTVNGDIVDVASARAALAVSGADAVMIGRGALGQPWLVGQVAAHLAGREIAPPPVLAEIEAIAHEHFELSLAAYGRELGCRVVRKHLAAYIDRNLAADAIDPEARRAVLQGSEPAAVHAGLERLFSCQRLRRAA